MYLCLVPATLESQWRWAGREAEQSEQVCWKTREREAGQDREGQPDPAQEDPGLSPRRGQGQDQQHPHSGRPQEEDGGEQEDTETSGNFQSDQYKEDQTKD